MLVSIFLISVAVLAYEIVLMRIFSITQWHHFAYMIISIALLGFGASGTFISVFRSRLTKRFRWYYRLFSCLFPLSIFLSYFLSQYNRFNPFEIVWDPRQYFHLLEYYLVLFLPFFFAAICIGLTFTCRTRQIGLLYGANLIGSGFGSLGVVLGFYLFHPVDILYIIIGLALCGAVAGFSDFERSANVSLLKRSAKLALPGRIMAFALLLISASLFFCLKYDPLALQKHLNISQYKGLSLAKNLFDAKILSESMSPLGIVHTVSSSLIRNAPGLSLNYTGDVPSQIAVFIDSGNAGVIMNNKNVEYLDFLPTSLVYHIRPVSNVLILGAGGGMDVLNALVHKATWVDAVELNPDIIYLVQDRFREFTSELYSRPNVHVINQEARGFIESTQSTYDAIQISLLDSFGASSSGVHALHENYLYTVEALKYYYSHLTPRGILTITRWVKFPPRDNLKLFATAVEALEESGDADIPQRLVSIRSWATSTLVLSKSPLASEEIERIRIFCRERSFDVNYFPGITAADANRYNQLPSAEYYRTAQELLFGEKEMFYKAYPYYIRPARDNSPYYFHFFKWRTLQSLLRTMGKEWVPFIEWGYLVLLATLLQAAIISLVLIILPLVFLPRRSTQVRDKISSVLYFVCLGLGYLFIEMVCIQKFTLYLANPVSAVSVVIASFLIFSGLGSLYFEFRVSHSNSQFATRNWRPQSKLCTPLLAAIGGIIGISCGYMLFLSNIFSFCAGWNDSLKILLSVALIAPLGFCMGIPFPFGLKQLSYLADELVPWAYGINGYASVLSSLIATCIAISFGFQVVMFCAGLLYAFAAGTAYMTSKW